QHQGTDVVIGPRPTRFSSSPTLSRACFLGPTGEGPRRDDGYQIPNRRPQRSAEPQKPLPLSSRHQDALGKPVSQNSILSFEILDLASQFSVGRRRNQGDECLERGRQAVRSMKNRDSVRVRHGICTPPNAGGASASDRDVASFWVPG